MKHVCFLLNVKKRRITAYLRAHQVWPEMRAALRKAGIRNYSMFLRKDGLLVGYFEAQNPRKSLEALGKTDVNRRWQEYMAPFFMSGSGDMKTGGLQWLDQIFHLK